MRRLGRSALILGLVLGTGGTAGGVTPDGGRPLPAVAAVAGPDGRSPAPSDTIPGEDTLPLEIDPSVADHVEHLDSLRQRTAELRAAITRLRVQFGVEVQRVVSGLRFLSPFRRGDGRDSADAERGGPLEQVAALARRYYPTASVLVQGTLPGGASSCGSSEERRRSRAAIQRLTGAGGLDAKRVRRAECAGGRLTTYGTRSPLAADTGVTVVIAWEPGGDSY